MKTRDFHFLIMVVVEAGLLGTSSLSGGPRYGPPTKPPRSGARVWGAGGLVTAPGRGVRIGADVLQISSKQNTGWMGKALGEEEAGAFREESARSGLPTVAIHCAYLINLASAKEAGRTRSLYALAEEAARAAMPRCPSASSGPPPDMAVCLEGVTLFEGG